MTKLMDDPTTYLSRDNDIPVIILAGSVDIAMEVARGYGVSIQVNGPDPQKGIRVVTNEDEAQQMIDTLPQETLWAAIPPGWTITTHNMLFNYFGPPKRMAGALRVLTEGIAWRPDRMIV